jgi:AraC-like DNA-binding protein
MGYPVVRDSTLRTHYESVERVIAAMRSRIDQPMTLRQMARIGFASPYHFNRTFRQITGVPPSQFLYALRLDAARRLLTQTQKKVIDICYEVGYNSVGTFTRRFAYVLGVPPTRFRKLIGSPARATSACAPMERWSVRRAQPGPSVTGHISAPRGFRGLVAVGLFTTPIPQGQPLACTLLTDGGMYCLPDAPEGEFYLFALALKQPVGSPVCFDHETALRAGGQRITISRASVQGLTSLHLRPPSPFDPPVLLLLPARPHALPKNALPLPLRSLAMDKSSAEQVI